jgi:predicted TIM-barrel fold metal-dependent hydrolase
MKTVGLEEHFVTDDVLEAWRGLGDQFDAGPLMPGAEGEITRRLTESTAQRLAAMDETGLDVTVLSLTTPGLQNLDSDDAVPLQVATNDRLAEQVRAEPDRLQGFATLATPAPVEAADELGRAVTRLGLNGAMVYGRTGERNLDHEHFWPIFEAAEALHAPLYLHPQPPVAAVRAAYYSGFSDVVDAGFATFGIGWHYDAGVQLLRLILSGVFDRFPDLYVIVGHWGEVVLFYLERIDDLSAFTNLARPVSDYVRTNVFVTPSGVFSHRYLHWAIEVVGIEHILFSTDYPYRFVPDSGARRFLEEADLTDADRDKIASGNWERLCAGIRR